MDVAKNSAQFAVAYDGEALKDHTIDVRDLAPALLGIGKLFEEANRVLNGDRAQVRVKLKATGEGSFDVILDVVQSLGRQLESLLLNQHVQTAIHLKTLIGLGRTVGTSLLGALSWIRGREAKKLSETEAEVTLGIDGETLVIPILVVRLMEDVPVRMAINRMLEPLQRVGIDTFKAMDGLGAIPSCEITKEQLAYFAAPEQKVLDQELPERTWTSAYTIVSLTFKEENKWRLSDGQAVISATILDKDFLERVDRGLSFSKGDVLVCEIRQRQTHTAEGLRTEYDVIRVDEHKPAPKQYKLFT